MNDLRNIVLGVSMAIDQLLVAFGLLDRVEILALDILNQRKLGGGRFIDIAHDRRDGVQPRPLRCTPATFAGDDLKALAVAVRPQQDRLEDTALGD